MENLIFGFLTGGSLILVIGPQNIFVIEQGLKNRIQRWEISRSGNTNFNQWNQKWRGGWKDGFVDGQGTYTFSSGTKGVGEFRKDKPWNVTEYNKNGNINGKYLKGEWFKN